MVVLKYVHVQMIFRSVVLSKLKYTILLQYSYTAQYQLGSSLQNEIV